MRAFRFDTSLYHIVTDESDYISSQVVYRGDRLDIPRDTRRSTTSMDVESSIPRRAFISRMVRNMLSNNYVKVEFWHDNITTGEQVTIRLCSG